MRLDPRPVVAVLAAALAIPLATVTVLPASAAGREAGTESVTLVLRGPDPDGLARLAHTGHAGRPGLLAANREILPGGAQRSDLRHDLVARGLTLTSESAWTITATGTPAEVASLTSGGGTGASPSPGPDGPAPTVPSGDLADAVSAVVAGGDGPPLVHPLASPVSADGADLRSVYATALAGPQAGHQALTVATLQFSGWDPSALTAHAAAIGLADPVSTGQYVGVSVAGASTTVVASKDDDAEVALDQESLLSVAPSARQRAYFADNSAQGFVQGIDAVTTDALSGGLNIVALSISWGGCEQLWTSSELAGVHEALIRAAAAGVTVFAASGDDGAYDCAAYGAPYARAVDYPASDPTVIGVGGTTITSVSPATETGWSGSGGGQSIAFSRPGYQYRAAPTATRRSVPDISTDADPASGMQVRWGHDGVHQAVVGGTSLASPVAAGLLVNALFANGRDTGLGDVHPQLYDAAASTFRDITTGSNGITAHAGYDQVTGRGSPLWDALTPSLIEAPRLSTPAYAKSRSVPLHVTTPAGVTYTSWRAGVGTPPTTCSGLGAATPLATAHAPSDGSQLVWVQGETTVGHCYLATATTIVDTVRPTARVSAALTSRSSPRHVTLTWTATEAKSSVRTSGVSKVSITVTRDRARTPFLTFAATGSGKKTFAAAEGHTYRASMSVTDRAGNSSARATAKRTVPLDDHRFTVKGAWTKRHPATAYEGSWRSSARARSTATVRATGYSFRLLVSTCRHCGRAAVYVDGRRIKVVDLYSRHTHQQVSKTITTTRYGNHRITVRVLGTHRRASHGSQVRIDGLVAVRA